MGICWSNKANKTLFSTGGTSDSSNLKRFTLSELKEATGNFPQDGIVGGGARGYVYKGWIANRSFAPANPRKGIIIAVKRLNIGRLVYEEIKLRVNYPHKEVKDEWLADIKYVNQLHHPNLLTLFGYCLEPNQRFLAYEFMPNGGLEKYLFNSNVEPLSWHLRMKIALGTAKGLACLHNAERPLMCRLFRTSSVLLDSNFDAKLSYSNIAMDRSGEVSSRNGHIAPELKKVCFTKKSDVFRFGVVLLEIISGKKQDVNIPHETRDLVEWIESCLGNVQIIFHSIEPRLKGQYTPAQALQVATLAGQCIRYNPKTRPTMDQVVETLEKLQVGCMKPHINSSTKETSSSLLAPLLGSSFKDNDV